MSKYGMVWGGDMRSNILTIVTSVLVMLLLAACVAEGDLKLAYNRTPVDLGDDWTIASPESQNIDIAAIEFAYERFFSKDEYRNAISLLIIRNNFLVAEGYARDMGDRTRYEAVQSISKSISALLTGIAIDEALITSLDLTINDIYPDKLMRHVDKQNISLRHLLTMSSGIEFDNDNFHVELVNKGSTDTIDYILNKPFYNSPGVEFYYRDADPHLLSYALQRLSGQSLAAYARTRLFQPLNISNYDWIKDSNNINYGAYGVYLTPRDLAKIGQLMLQNGQWNSVQVVSASWINDSVTKQIENSSATTANYDYGFYWWLIPELNAYTAWGHGGNFVTVMPDKQLVVVLTSFPNSGNNVGTHLDEFLPVLRRLYNGAN